MKTSKTHVAVRDSSPESRNVGPAIVEEIFNMLFNKLYNEGIDQFDTVEDVLAACAACVRKEVGKWDLDHGPNAPLVQDLIH